MLHSLACKVCGIHCPVYGCNKISCGMPVMDSTLISCTIFFGGVPDTISCTNQLVTDIKENVTNFYWTMTMTGCLFQGLNYVIPVIIKINKT